MPEVMEPSSEVPVFKSLPFQPVEFTHEIGSSGHSGRAGESFRVTEGVLQVSFDRGGSFTSFTPGQSFETKEGQDYFIKVEGSIAKYVREPGVVAVHDSLVAAAKPVEIDRDVDPFQGGSQSRGVDFGDDALGTPEDDEDGFGFRAD